MNREPENIRTAYIGVGSNLADRKANIDQAVSKLSRLSHVEVAALSAIKETLPLAGKNQPAYLNAVAKVRTTLSPYELFCSLREIEKSLGRIRQDKWASRTIDLDLLLFGLEVVNTPQLTIPHSRMHLRSFVLDGLCELDGNTIHPVLKRSVSELAARLNGRDFFIDRSLPQLICVSGIIGVGKTTLAKALADVFNCPLIAEAYDKNPYLADVYMGRKELALESQLFFLHSRVEQLNKDNLPAGRIYVSDYVFDKETIYARQTLSKEQLEIYMVENIRQHETIAAPAVVVYMKDTAQACLKRIEKRNRSFEKVIDIAALLSLAEDYGAMFEQWTNSPVITIDAGRFNCLDRQQVLALAEELKHYVWYGS